ncbi:hypothetical protein LZ620_01655 [Aeromonas salmonicida]|nr:hypothetical protein [Aeromonas salmonicida]
MVNYPFISEGEKNYKALMGKYISTWSSVEWNLYEIIKSIYILYKPTENIKKGQMPLKRKLEILENFFHDLPGLQNERKEVDAIIDFIKKEQNFRHNLIHGVNAEIMKREPWYTLMWRPEQSEDYPTSADDVELITEKTILEHYDEITYLGFCLIGLNRRIFNRHKEEMMPDI